MKKCHVGVIYGGCSGEHEISLLSAASVIAHLDREKFDVTPIGIDKTGHWYLNDLATVFLPEKKVLSVKADNSTQLPIPQSAYELPPHQHFDVLFPVVHGPLYEDGSLQGVLRSAHMPYVGCGVLGSAISMDKDVAKCLLKAANIPTAPWLAFTCEQWAVADHTGVVKTVIDELGLPVFVKAANLGSSVGVHCVKEAEALIRAIENAFQYDTKIIIEKGINAREIELGVIDNITRPHEPLVSCPGEFTYSADHDFYSYAAKYCDTAGLTFHVPADLSEEQTLQAQHIARDAFRILNIDIMARVDLFLDRDTGAFYCNELNTIPGFTDVSMFPLVWEASGLSYTHLLTTLIELALARFERDKQIKRSYQPAL